MGLGRARGIVISGITAHIVEVEAHLSAGLPSMTIVGLGDTSVSESRDRVRAAVLNSGAAWPAARITIGLSPASLHKRGSGLDLAIASAILVADGQIPPGRVVGSVLFGELGLDGRVRPVRGAVVAAVEVANAGTGELVVCHESRAEAELIPGLQVTGVRTLAGWIGLLRGEPAVDAGESREPDPHEALSGPPQPDRLAVLDLCDVRGQAEAVAALEVVAAGGHHMSMIGRPGVGKTMLAERLPSLLPDLSDDDALVVTAIQSVVGVLPHGLVRRPPFQAPHHTATLAALVGGGAAGVVRPGHITMAHGGVLFLDEAPEFGPACLESLRQPLESGRVCIARAGFSAELPARFQLVLAANPCPCGNAIGKGSLCRCSPADRRRYERRLSGPLLDRVDVHLTVHAPQISRWGAGETPQNSAEIRARVVAARQRAAARARRLGYLPVLNCQLPGRLLHGCLAPAPEVADVLGAAVQRGSMSARGADRAIRVGWTIADCTGVDRPGMAEIGRALTLRGEDRGSQA